MFVCVFGFHLVRALSTRAASALDRPPAVACRTTKDRAAHDRATGLRARARPLVAKLPRTKGTDQFGGSNARTSFCIGSYVTPTRARRRLRTSSCWLTFVRFFSPVERSFREALTLHRATRGDVQSHHPKPAHCRKQAVSPRSGEDFGDKPRSRPLQALKLFCLKLFWLRSKTRQASRHMAVHGCAHSQFRGCSGIRRGHPRGRR